MFIYYMLDRDYFDEWNIWVDDDFPQNQVFDCNECHWLVPNTYVE